MSLFEDSRYQYRDTYFVFFKKANRPSADKVQACIAELGSKYKLLTVATHDDELESLTVVSPLDFSGMDIAYVEGEEVESQISELMEDFRTITLTGDDSKKLSRINGCDARFDIFHFERVDTGGEEDEFLDPGGLLLVLEKLASVSGGIALDPQSQTLM